MCPCSPLDVSIDLPSGPSGLAISGFGVPFALKIPDINPFPEGFPEDLLDLLNKLQMLIPPGALKPALNPNFGKDIFDAIMKLLDQFLPFLMLYKFFLPLLNIIICIIEVLCALKNPFKLIKAMKRLFRHCLPDFLNLFPIFALIIMLISLLLLLLQLIEYIINQILKLIKTIIRNIIALGNAFKEANNASVLAIAKKLGSLLCIFQNLFVLLSLFSIIINIIRDILSLSFSIPPCDNTDPTNVDGCCSTDVCPTIVKNNYTRFTGTFKYLNSVSATPEGVVSLPFPYNSNAPLRNESWQLFDDQQELLQEFVNIIDAHDVLIFPKPIFFPTDIVYTSQTAIKQAVYTLDLRLFYNPAQWGRTGTARFIRFTDCVMTVAPTTNLSNYDNTNVSTPKGVVKLAGGLGFEDNGTTILTGFGTDAATPITNQATLENFLHQLSGNIIALPPVFSATDGYTFSNIEYTFKPNMAALISKDLVTLGCDTDFAFDRTFINNVIAGDATLKFAQLGALVNSSDFPNTTAAQECLSVALSGLRGNLTLGGVAQFQATTDICLNKLKGDTNKALSSLIGLGFDPCKSSFTAIPHTQFTTQPVAVKVNLNERNGLSISTGLSSTIAADLASRLKAHITFGNVSDFTYDGYQAFTANLTSPLSGTGQIMISFDDNILCTNTIPANTDLALSHDLQVVDYKFIFAPSAAGTADDGTDKTQPRRDEGDLARGGVGRDS